MLNSTDRMASEKAEREAAAKSARRAEEASIVAGLRTVLQADEQLLGFARARIAGGIKGRLNIGPEAFFAPFVNIGLTERRFVIQHLHGETGKPSEILPHFFAFADLQSIHFADIETYGGTPASRLVLHLANGQSFRLRLVGENNFASAKSLAEVFRSLTSVRKSASGPTQRVCVSCKHIMDRVSKFCPYCGSSQMEVETAQASQTSGAEPMSAEPDTDVEKVTVVVTEAPSDMLDDALAFLRNDPVESSAPVSEFPSEPASEQTESVPVSSHEPTQAEQPDNVAESAATASDSTGITESAAMVLDSTNEAEPTATALDSTNEAEPTTTASDSTNETEQSTTASDSVDNFEILPLPAPVTGFTNFSSSANWQHSTQPSGYPVPGTVSSSESDESGESTATTVSSVDPQIVQEPSPTAVDTGTPASGFVPSAFTYSETGSSDSTSVPREEAQQMPAKSASIAGPLRVHFHIKHPAVQFDAVITGRDADDVVTQLQGRVVSELKFPVKMIAMRLSPLEFAQEIVSKYNAEERQSLPRPNSCREFLHLVQAIGYATVDSE